MSRGSLVVVLVAVASMPWAQAQEKPAKVPAAPALITYLNPGELAASPRYSHAALVAGGRLVLVSGELPLDAQGLLVGKDDFQKQAEQVFANIKVALAAAGAGPKDVVAIETFYLNRADLPAYRDARAEFFAGRAEPPTSTTVQVVGLVAEGALLEVGVTAVLPVAQPKPRAR